MDAVAQDSVDVGQDLHLSLQLAGDPSHHVIQALLGDLVRHIVFVI
jgi:hypothetical protein